MATMDPVSTMSPVTSSSLFRPFTPFATSPTTPKSQSIESPATPEKEVPSTCSSPASLSHIHMTETPSNPASSSPVTTASETDNQESPSGSNKETPQQRIFRPFAALSPTTSSNPSPVSFLNTSSTSNTLQSTSIDDVGQLGKEELLASPDLPPATLSPGTLPDPPSIPTTRREDRIEPRTDRITGSGSNKPGWVGNSRRFRSDGDLKSIANMGLSTMKRVDSPRWRADTRTKSADEWKPVRFRRVVQGSDSDCADSTQKKDGDRIVKPVARRDQPFRGFEPLQLRGQARPAGIPPLPRGVNLSKTDYPLKSSRLAFARTRRRCQSVDFDGIGSLQETEQADFDTLAKQACTDVLVPPSASPVSLESSYGGNSQAMSSRELSMESSYDPQIQSSSDLVLTQRAVSNLSPGRANYVSDLLVSHDALDCSSNSSDSLVYGLGDNPAITSSMRNFDAYRGCSSKDPSSSFAALQHIPRRSRIFRSFRPSKSGSVSSRDNGNLGSGIARLKQGIGHSRRPSRAPEGENANAKDRSDRRLLRFLRQSFNRQSKKRMSS